MKCLLCEHFHHVIEKILLWGNTLIVHTFVSVGICGPKYRKNIILMVLISVLCHRKFAAFNRKTWCLEILAVAQNQVLLNLRRKKIRLNEAQGNGMRAKLIFAYPRRQCCWLQTWFLSVIPSGDLACRPDSWLWFSPAQAAEIWGSYQKLALVLSN